MSERSIRLTSELERIIALPRRRTDDAQWVDLAAQLTELLRTPNGTQTLRSVQAMALHDIGTTGSGFLPIGVGEGKTLISLLAPYVLDAKRPLLLLPAALIKKTERERVKYAEHWRVASNIKLLSYEMLGRVQASGELEKYQPDLIIGDEIHKVKAKKAAVTRRVARYMHDHPETKFVGMSGTVMRKSLEDFGGILRWCLKGNAPVPKSEHELEEWAQALDDKVTDEARFEPGALLHLCTPEEIVSPEAIANPVLAARRGFQRRLTETPGVVATAGEAERVDCSIYVKAITYDVKPITEAHFYKLRSEWMTPDGWPLCEAVDVWRHSRELALGFHYVRVEKERYVDWRTQTLKRSKGPEHATELEIRAPSERHTITCERQARPEELRHALATQRTQKSTELTIAREHTNAIEECSDPQYSSPGTASQQTIGTSYTLPATGAVRFAEKVRLVGSALTTITRPTESEDCYASHAIAPSDALATMSPGYRERFNTFLEENRPPREWLDARRDWSSFVREVLSRSRTLDSELDVANACDAGKLSAETLNTWRAIRDTFVPNTVAIWHDDTVLRACAEWMKKPGIVWTSHSFFARGLAQLTGCAYYGAEGLTDDGSRFIEDADPRDAVIASVKANREGRNLQKLWSRNLVVSPPDGADAWQQLIGRTHRPGQQADEVTIDVLLGCREHANAWRKALASAYAIRDTVGAEQKLLLADIDWPSDEEIARFKGARWETSAETQH